MTSPPTDRKSYVPPREEGPDGAFIRQEYVFRDWVTCDGSSDYPAEPGRYHLYTCAACAWSQRAEIVRKLKGLEATVGLSRVDPIRDDRGWRFNDEFPDEVNGFSFLREAYLATDPSYDLSPTVPVLWDAKRRRIVSNNFHDVTIMLATEFEEHADTATDILPPDLRDEIGGFNEMLYLDVNNGVYRCGFARSQEAYEEAFDRLFTRLDELDRRLEDRRFLFGEQITAPDIRLFVTLVRFDAVYYVHFKCNRRRLVDYSSLWAYARDLYQRPAFRETTDFDQIKRHYYLTHPQLNPSGIVPKGPEADWEAPHGRHRLA